ncbi:hypothetical protein MtrunA17_Chr7g0261741 [Medicago truncatula]|uniref:Transmembrane protein n=1 Tax=Medicago truncatula TaxID=3880 RepID=A0A396H633_MEDTR|nr:hypothetical protein MtrunA17_Chr7g0261741 [Medicago truncatula]
MNEDFGVKKKNGYGEEEEWLWRKKRTGELWGRRIQRLYNGHVRVFIFIFFVLKIHVGCSYGTK